MEIEARRRLVRRLALLGAAMVFAVTSLSAFVRLSNDAAATAALDTVAAEAGAVAAEAEMESEAVVIARRAHRLVASATLLVVVGLVGLSLGPRPYLRREGLLALGMFCLVAFLAVLGRWSSGTVAPAVTLGNLLGGFLLFALSWRLAWPAPPAEAVRLRSLAWPALLALTAQVALGALSHAAHPWSAIIVAALVLALARGAWRIGWRSAALALAMLLALQLAIGISHIAAGSPPTFVLVHNMVALLLFATTLRMVGKPGKPGSDPHFGSKMGV